MAFRRVAWVKISWNKRRGKVNAIICFEWTELVKSILMIAICTRPAWQWVNAQSSIWKREKFAKRDSLNAFGNIEITAQARQHSSVRRNVEKSYSDIREEMIICYKKNKTRKSKKRHTRKSDQKVCFSPRLFLISYFWYLLYQNIHLFEYNTHLKTLIEFLIKIALLWQNSSYV